MTTSTAPATVATTPLLVAISPRTGAAGRDKVAGPTLSLSRADHLLTTRRPFRAPLRSNGYTGETLRSVTASLYRVELVDRPEHAAPSTVLVAYEGYRGNRLDYGAAPADVRTAFLAELAAAIDACPAGQELQAYVVKSYSTPIAWGFHHVAPVDYPLPGSPTEPGARRLVISTRGTYSPEIVSEPYTWSCAGETIHSERHAAASLLSVPDVRYSNTTTQHQGACLAGRIRPADPAAPVSDAERFADGVEYVTIGRRVDVGDPGAVRRGRGKSPFGSRDW